MNQSAEGTPGANDSGNVYETDELVEQYLHFHYGEGTDLLPYEFGPSSALGFPVRCVTECLSSETLKSASSAIDIGCAVGRSSFELAKHCDRVLGIDYSEAFIAAANKLKEEGSLPYRAKLEGSHQAPLVATVDTSVKRSNVQFEHGDAMLLKEMLQKDMRLKANETYDIALLANLLCRLPEPLRCLEQLPSLMNPGGSVVITTPCTWMEEFTPKQNWLGGKEPGDSTINSIQTVLNESFELVLVKDLPFLIREHIRKFQWSVAEASVWKRRT